MEVTDNVYSYFVILKLNELWKITNDKNNNDKKRHR